MTSAGALVRRLKEVYCVGEATRSPCPVPIFASSFAIGLLEAPKEAPSRLEFAADALGADFARPAGDAASACGPTSNG